MLHERMNDAILGWYDITMLWCVVLSIVLIILLFLSFLMAISENRFYFAGWAQVLAETSAQLLVSVLFWMVFISVLRAVYGFVFFFLVHYVLGGM